MYVKLDNHKDWIEISPYIPCPGKKPYLILDGSFYYVLSRDSNRLAVDGHFWRKFGLSFSHVEKLVSRLRKRPR